MVDLDLEAFEEMLQVSFSQPHSSSSKPKRQRSLMLRDARRADLGIRRTNTGSVVAETQGRTTEVKSRAPQMKKRSSVGSKRTS